MQDLFCKLATSRSFAAATDRLAYAIRMATNLAFDDRRSRRRILPEAVIADHQPAATESPLVDLVRREELERLLNALGRLPEDSRAILVLRYLEQEDYAAIGRQLGKTPRQARALCHKAVTRLRKALDSQPEIGKDLERPRK